VDASNIREGKCTSAPKGHGQGGKRARASLGKLGGGGSGVLYLARGEGKSLRVWKGPRGTGGGESITQETRRGDAKVKVVVRGKGQAKSRDDWERTGGGVKAYGATKKRRSVGGSVPKKKKSWDQWGPKDRKWKEKKGVHGVKKKGQKSSTERPTN